MSDIVTLKNCYKTYRTWKSQVHALKNIDFSIKKGSVHGLIGPNGAGKTTLIKLILGLIRPSKGSINIFGNNNLDKNAKQKIGFLPEETYLYDFLSIRETIEFAAKLYKNKEHGLSRIDSLIQLVGLQGKADRKISECSKGMARRAALAQTIVQDPEFVILDEPTSGFDPVGVSDMKNIIKSLKNDGKTILLCSHQLADVQAVCDYITVLYQGNLITQGEVKTLLNTEKKDTYNIINNEKEIDIPALLKNNTIEFEHSHTDKSLEDFFIKTIKKWSLNT